MTSFKKPSPVPNQPSPRILSLVQHVVELTYQRVGARSEAEGQRHSAAGQEGISSVCGCGEE
jgi:hypothetical protein